jgi:hypothetical protein
MPASPSLLIVPARFKTGKLYTQIATTSAGVVLGSSGDFNVTRATTATRFNSAGLIESVASGVPRLDYYTSGGTAGCPALLVEPSGSNGILNSQDTATNWALGPNLTSGYVDVIGVSGNNLTVAASGSGIGSSAGALRRTSNNVALASGSTYTISFLMRQTGTHTIGGYYAAITGGAAGDLGAGFNVSGSFSSGSLFAYTGATSRIRRVERFGADVYRCSETFTMTASGTLTTLSIGPTVSVTSDTNSASGTTMAFAAPQIELGAIPTSFIPTTTASATRNADVITLSGAVSGCIGQTEGTLYAEIVAQPYNNASFPAILQVDDGADSQRFAIFIGPSGGIRVRFNASGVNASLDSTNPATLVVGQTYKIAAAFGFNGSQAFYINGVLQVSGSVTAGPFTAALNRVMLGHRAGIVSPFLIRSAAIYTTRLTNAELAALTTP